MIGRITLIGLGLIGGSLGLALKRTRGAEVELVGYARRPETRDRAYQLGAVDRAENSLPAAVKEADLVILATPLSAIKEILGQLRDCLSPACIVTDTASTKAMVMKWVEECLPGANFIGGHPMAGKEISGIEAAEANLFDHCTYCLTPGRATSPEAVETLAELVRQVGAMPLFIDALEHDKLVAGISHLPFLLSVALVSTTSQDSHWSQLSKLAASGYRDLTRLASQNPEMNWDICLTNQQNIVDWIDDFIRELSRFRHLVREGDPELREAFMEAQRARQQWLKERGYDKKA